MNAHLTAKAIALALATSCKPALAAVHIYAHDTEVLPDGSTQSPVEEIQLPGVFIRVQFEPLTSSVSIGRGKVEIDVESQSDDSTSEEHSRRESAVLEVLGDVIALTEAFQETGGVVLLGKPAPIATDPNVEHRAFKTPMNFRVGVRAL